MFGRASYHLRGVVAQQCAAFMGHSAGGCVHTPPAGLPARALGLARCLSNPAVASEVDSKEKQISRIRDFAIIAHVDHGKTTLMDKLIFHGGEASTTERVMDSGVFEKERGITITSKYTSFTYNGHMLNAVDTPGHADFGGEVERILGMVDGCLLVVDVTEGAMAQTKYVLGKALAMGLRPIVVFNKIDRPSATRARCDEVHLELFDLFANMGATDLQLDFPVIYASGKDGWTLNEYPEGRGEGMGPLLDAIVESIPAPSASPDLPFKMLVTMLEHDNYVGRIATGRVAEGIVREGDRIKLMPVDGSAEEEGRVTRIFKKSGTGKVNLAEAVTGDIISLAGLATTKIADTIAAPSVTERVEPGQVDPPTLAMVFAPNSSPIGRNPKNIVTAQKIVERLENEAAVSVSLRVRRVGGAEEAVQVEARGELQLGLLIEGMRRDGFELELSPPKVLTRTSATGSKLEPVEEVTCEVPDACVGELISGLQIRKGVLEDMQEMSGHGRTRLVFVVPTRGLIGFRSLFTTMSHGEGIMNRAFKGYEEYSGPMDRVRKGALVCMADGKASAYAMFDLQARGTMFMAEGEHVYGGMIVGESNTEGDLEVNPAKEKKLSNVRSKGADEKLTLYPPRQVTLEDSIGYIQWDELIEITPEAIRLRKKVLNPSDRKKFMRSNSELS